MLDTNDFMLACSDLFAEQESNGMLANVLQEPCASNHLPSPTASTDSFDPQLTRAVFDTNVFQNIPATVLQSLTHLYLQQQQQQQPPPLLPLPGEFEQFVKFEQDSVHEENVLGMGINAGEPASRASSPQTPTATPAAVTHAASTATSNASATKTSKRSQRQLECFNCHVTKTPLWRRTPDRAHSLCNACGLYYKQYGNHRPLHVRQKHAGAVNNLAPVKKQQQQQQQQQQQTSSHVAMAAAAATVNLLRPLLSQPAEPMGAEMRCHSCQQTSSASLGSKNSDGQWICQACGLYGKAIQLNGPMTLPQKRSREDSQEAAGQDETGQDTLENTKKQRQQEWPENDDSRFRALLQHMNTQQMHGFLDMLERRCAILRSLLYADTNMYSPAATP